MSLQFTPTTVPLVVATLILGALCGYAAVVYRRRGGGAVRAFGVAMAFLGLWALLTVVQEVTITLTIARWIANALNVFVVPLSVYSILWFALTYSGNERWVNRRTVGIVVLHVVGATVAVLLDPTTFFTSALVVEPATTILGVTFEPYLAFEREPTAVFLAFQLYSYVLLLTAAVVLGRFLFRYRDEVYRGQAVALLFGILFPTVVNTLLFAGIIPSTYNLTELAGAPAGIAFAIGIFRYRMMDLVPVARNTVIEDMREGYVVCNDRHVVLDANPAAREIMGMNGQSLTGSPIESVLPAVEPLLGTPDAETTGEIELQVDGESRILTTSVSPLGTGEREAGFLITFRDITERVRSERQLAEEREKYSTLVEQSHDGVMIITDGTIAFVNQRLEALVDRPESELLGMAYDELVAPEDRDLVRERYERWQRGGDVPDRYDVELVTADGERRVADVQVTEIDYEGAVAVMVTLNDITERKAYERHLEEQNRKLAVLNRIVRHDIRNDMSVVLGHAQLLAEDLGDTQAALSADLDAMVAKSEKIVELTDVVGDLMETMREDGDQLHPVSLRPVLEAELDDVRTSNEHASVRTSRLPDVSVLADDMLTSVFRNLLANAVKHTDDPHPEVAITVSMDDDHVQVRVKDNGPGIPDSRKEAVFGRGEKGLESTGTGIGLYLVDVLVEGYDGDVWIEDNEPRGTVVVVELQRASNPDHSGR